jgi:hypothetical protein
LITKLPADGTWATYVVVGEERRPNEIAHEFKGTITIRSVGEEVEQDQGMKQLRWIEIEQRLHHGDEPLDAIHKFLIPENEIGEGKNPISKIRKLWSWQSQYQMAGPELVEPKSKKAGVLSGILPPSFENRKALEAKLFKLPVGELLSTGWSGSGVEKDLERKFQVHRIVEAYSNDASPFGSVQFKVTNDIESFAKSIATFTLNETGINAKSAWPDNK